MTIPRCLMLVEPGGCAPAVLVSDAPGYGADFGPNPAPVAVGADYAAGPDNTGWYLLRLGPEGPSFTPLTERQLDQLNAERIAADNLRRTEVAVPR